MKGTAETRGDTLLLLHVEEQQWDSQQALHA